MFSMTSICVDLVWLKVRFVLFLVRCLVFSGSKIGSIIFIHSGFVPIFFVQTRFNPPDQPATRRNWRFKWMETGLHLSFSVLVDFGFCSPKPTGVQAYCQPMSYEIVQLLHASNWDTRIAHV